MTRVWNRMRTGIAVILIILLTCGSVFGIWSAVDARKAYDVPALTEAELADLDLSHVKRLMIVAHPDDETIWGGAHLSEGGYLVVCLTNGNNQTRAAEFQAVMAQSGNVGLILSYPDKVGGKRDNWNHVQAQMKQDLELVMTYRPWESIVTHNAAGEYGHIHHKMTHQFVTEIYDTSKLDMPLYNFGKYYRAAVLPSVESTLTPVSKEALQEKESLLTLYASQERVVKSLSHMNPYEIWTETRGGDWS